MCALNADLLHVRTVWFVVWERNEESFKRKRRGQKKEEREGAAGRFTFALVGKKVMEGGRCFVADSCWREWVGPDPKKEGIGAIRGRYSFKKKWPDFYYENIEQKIVRLTRKLFGECFYAHTFSCPIVLYHLPLMPKSGRRTDGRSVGRCSEGGLSVGGGREGERGGREPAHILLPFSLEEVYRRRPPFLLRFLLLLRPLRRRHISSVVAYLRRFLPLPLPGPQHKGERGGEMQGRRGDALK